MKCFYVAPRLLLFSSMLLLSGPFLWMMLGCQNIVKDNSSKIGKAEAHANRSYIAKKQFGVITPDTTPEELLAWFGTDNVQSDSLRASANAFMPVSVVYKGKPDEFSVIWNDADNRITRIMVAQKGSKWVFDQGLTVGTTLAELRKINQVDFTFLGFAQQPHAGTILSWEGGALENKNIGLQLALADISNSKELSIESQDKILFNEVSSAEPTLANLNVIANRIFITF